MNIDTILENLKSDLRVFIEEEIAREVERRLGSKSGSGMLQSHAQENSQGSNENILFDLEELSSRAQTSNVSFDESAMKDLEELANSQPVGGATSSVTTSSVDSNYNAGLDSLISMSNNPIVPIETGAQASVISDQFGTSTSQPSPVLVTPTQDMRQSLVASDITQESYAPGSGMRNAFKFLKRVLKS